jgi:RimJ/RimL family protein N-acetyltransferase
MIFTETERLILRRPRAEDYEALLHGWSDPEMRRYMPDRPDLPDFVATMIADMQIKRPGEAEPGGPWYQYAVERRCDGAVIGDLGAGFGVPGEQQVELGYRILPQFHRLGYGREAVAAIIDHLIEEHRIHRFVAIAASQNSASCALIRSLGFRQEGHFRQSFWCGGEWIDDAYFALLASEWPSATAHD